MTYSSSRRRRSSINLEEEMRKAKAEFKKRMSKHGARKSAAKPATGTKNSDMYDDYDVDDVEDKDEEEQLRLVVQIAVRAGLLAVAGLSLCFSTLFIPGVIPFLGGLLCGVSLVEPPPLPGDMEQSTTTDSGGTPKKYRDLASRSGGDNGVVKQMLMNMIHHFF